MDVALLVVATGALTLAGFLGGRCSRRPLVATAVQLQQLAWTAGSAVPLPPAVYRDGTYLISEQDGCFTWAVCEGDRWGVVYECKGHQLIAGWVEPRDIPLTVLASALPADAEGPDRETPCP